MRCVGAQGDCVGDLDETFGGRALRSTSAGLPRLARGMSEIEYMLCSTWQHSVGRVATICFWRLRRPERDLSDLEHSRHGEKTDASTGMCEMQQGIESSRSPVLGPPSRNPNTLAKE